MRVFFIARGSEKRDLPLSGLGGLGWLRKRACRGQFRAEIFDLAVPGRSLYPIGPHGTHRTPGGSRGGDGEAAKVLLIEL